LGSRSRIARPFLSRTITSSSTSCAAVRITGWGAGAVCFDGSCAGRMNPSVRSVTTSRIWSPLLVIIVSPTSSAGRRWFLVRRLGAGCGPLAQAPAQLVQTVEFRTSAVGLLFPPGPGVGACQGVAGLRTVGRELHSGLQFL